MKKIILILIIGAMFIISGCTDKKEPKVDDTKVYVMKTNVKSAKIFIDNYMRYAIKRNQGPMHSFYGSKIKTRIKNTTVSKDPHPIGYSVSEGEGKDKKAEFKVHIFSGSTNLPYFSDDEFKYIVGMEKTKMVIEDIEKGKSVELFEKNKVLYKREGDKLKGEPLISLKDLPNYAVPKESSILEQKFAVPKESFGPCALSPDGKSSLITSFYKNSFIGIIDEEDSSSAQTMARLSSQPKSGGQGKSQSGGGSGGSNSGGGEQNTNPSSNMRLRTVDFYSDTKVNNVNYSPDGKMFVIEFTQKPGISQILVYKSKSAERIILKSDKQFRIDRFSMTDPYFSSPMELVFTLNPNKNATLEEKKFKGDWKLDIEKGKLSLIE